MKPLVLLFVLVAACGDEDPATLYGEWELRTVNGQALPASIGNAAGCSEVIESGRVNLGGPPQAVSVTTRIRTSPCFPPGSRTETFTPRFSLTGNQLLLLYDAMGGRAAFTDTATFAGLMDSLRVRSRFFASDATPMHDLVYVRTR